MKEEHFVVTSRDAIRHRVFDRESAIACAMQCRVKRRIAASVNGPG